MVCMGSKKNLQAAEEVECAKDFLKKLLIQSLTVLYDFIKHWSKQEKYDYLFNQSLIIEPIFFFLKRFEICEADSKFHFITRQLRRNIVPDVTYICLNSKNLLI